jgi:hypothetical protein
VVFRKNRAIGRRVPAGAAGGRDTERPARGSAWRMLSPSTAADFSALFDPARVFPMSKRMTSADPAPQNAASRNRRIGIEKNAYHHQWPSFDWKPRGDSPIRLRNGTHDVNKGRVAHFLPWVQQKRPRHDLRARVPL